MKFPFFFTEKVEVETSITHARFVNFVEILLSLLATQQRVSHNKKNNKNNDDI